MDGGRERGVREGERGIERKKREKEKNGWWR